MITELQTRLEEISKENATSEAVFNALSKRMRARNVTNLNLLKYALINEGIQIVTEQYFEVFKKLEALGVGALIRGRKTKSGAISPARFIWHYNLKDIGKVAKGKIPDTNIRKMSQVDTEEHEEVVEHEPSKQNFIMINRNGLKVNIELPKDIQPEELAAWLSLVKELKK